MSAAADKPAAETGAHVLPPASGAFDEPAAADEPPEQVPIRDADGKMIGLAVRMPGFGWAHYDLAALYPSLIVPYHLSPSTDPRSKKSA